MRLECWTKLPSATASSVKFRNWRTQPLILAALALLNAMHATGQSDSLSITGVQDIAANSIIISVILGVAGSAPASLQFDLIYPGSTLTLAQGTYDVPGSAATVAGKFIFCNLVASGTLRCAVTGVNTNPIGNGVLATIAFQLGSGSSGGSFAFSVQNQSAADPNGSAIALTAGGTTVSTVSASTGLSYVAVTPCRILDTRQAVGPFGGPEMTGGSSRSFGVPDSNCGIPSSAVAYAVNVTVVPDTTLSYLTLYPTGQGIPGSSTMNSNGQIKANAAIVAAGDGGAVSVYVSDPTQVILDISGYFVPYGTRSSALAFYPLAPCRIADTRPAAGFTGVFGPPYLPGGQTRSFPISSSSCGVPSTAQAYSLNMTVIPHAYLGYLTVWPSGTVQPIVSTLNSSLGYAIANAAIVPAGGDGAISVYPSDDTDLVIDANGYFAPPATGGLSLYPVPLCRVLDTRFPAGSEPSSGTMIINVSDNTNGCTAPATGVAYVLNATVVPQGPLDFLTLWPANQAQPNVSTLNSVDGSIVSNLAIVGAISGGINSYLSDPAYLILDISGYFAP